MQPARRFSNGPVWHQNQRVPFNGPDFHQRFPMNLNQQAMLVPLLQVPVNGIYQQFQPSTSARPLIESAPSVPPHFQQNQSRKRRNETSDNSTFQNNKRARPSQDDTSNNDTSPTSLDKFVVPINRGTEQITIAIWDYFLSAQMTDDDLKKKLLLRKSLLSVLEDSFPECRLFIVGSSMTGFATRSSDVDMCLVISDEEIHQKREAPLVLLAITKALRHCSFVNMPQVIRAKVPILKFRDRLSGVECDLNVNNTIGVRNTHLLRYYAYMDWRVRPLLLFIKRWARFHDINDASKKTISSYSLSLMLIHFLQAGVKPPVVPCLQRMKPDLFSADSDVRGLSLKMEKIDFKSKNTATLGELFLGFLHYYTSVFRYSCDMISVRTGNVINKYTATGDPAQWKNLCIEEPFEGSNTARSVYDFYVFQRILRVFSNSFRRLGQERDCRAILNHPF